MIHHFRTILGLAVALGLGYVVAHVLLPWTIRRVLKLLGREIRLSPIWRRRLQRFRSIRRGYWAFVAITSAFTSSLFLEFYINDQALLIVYKGKWASPAFRQWADLWLPWDVPHFLPANEWGLEHEGPIKYREYQRYCNEPGAFAERIRSAEKMLEDSRTRFAEMEEPKLPPEPVRPESDDPFDLELYETDRLVWDAEKAKLADKIREYEFRRDDLVEQAALVETLRGNESAFEGGQAWVLLPVYPYGPGESLLDLAGRPPHPPLTEDILLGTTDSGRDVLVQLLYGFRISLAFALLILVVGEAIGILVGGVMGYYGRWVDILVQRFIEIWGAIPFLYTIMILAAILQPSFLLLAILLIVLQAWIGITVTVRGEFYREKAKDYVQAAIAIGVSDWKILTKHILPNSLVPVVSYAPFSLVYYIFALVSLDYLGFGLPPGTPSWGYLFQQGQEHIEGAPHLILLTTGVLVATLFSVVTIGESVREAFDPKVFSRLR